MHLQSVSKILPRSREKRAKEKKQKKQSAKCKVQNAKKNTGKANPALKKTSHYPIISLAHPHIRTSAHPHINTSAHPHINTSAHQHINTSTHQHINTSAHQLLPSPPEPALTVHDDLFIVDKPLNRSDYLVLIHGRSCDDEVFHGAQFCF